ncbi:potassium channel family protein [Xylocopilactobacillus apicola]|uniref:Ion transporter n=1 Tax=Xylocopilactobacillus apicola TaxID=2932184 RepID=A0AAU9D296_9LACO|nr:potassium channel family protein [Xylocopilactobacillus apicola]BDR57849.1 ion transporter [Xylocopilactobacillus apicola]
MTENGKKQLSKLYTILMALLAIVSIVLVIMDYASLINIEISPYSYLDSGILIVFAIDYFARLLLSKNKWQFFKSNIFDLLAIIPFNSLFSVFRLTRLFRLARLTKALRFIRLVGLTGKLQESAKRFLKTNGLIYLIIICGIILIISSVLYSLAENVSLENAFWWAIATATTVGYGDISPQTPVGRFAAIMLMFVGIGLIGSITSAITTFFTQNKEDNNTEIILRKLDEIERENQQLHAEISKLNREK